jgi:hypothetical protein
MTGAQADWLRANKAYRAVGNVPSGGRYIKRGMLHEDGTFELIYRGVRPNIRVGSFEVGILEMPGAAPSMQGPV